MYKLVLIRHGQSQWNLENRFTGWADVDLTEKGVEQAIEAGKLLKANGFDFDVAYTSVLKRAIRTLWHTLDEMDRLWLPVVNSWRLNERHYGGLTGLNKKDTAAKHGEEQVHIWRRSYDIRPPLIERGTEFDMTNDVRYSKLKPEEIPLGECLKDTVERVLPIWEESLSTAIRRGRRVVVSAHGNSIRALVKILDNVSDEDIMAINIPNGKPLVYELDADLKPIKHYYLES